MSGSLPPAYLVLETANLKGNRINGVGTTDNWAGEIAKIRGEVAWALVTTF